MIEKLKKTPVDVVGDYLERLVFHLMEVLKRRFSTALQTMELQYILTVPAVWSDKAKDATMRAAHLAKIPPSALILLSEPEAAAVYAIHTVQPNSLKLNDCLIVCDAGGGTVDIITYRIAQTEPLRFSEVTEGTGAVCGSALLDDAFQDLLETEYKKTYKRPIPKATMKAARQYWQDYIKPTFRGPIDDDDFEETPYQVPLPGGASHSGTRGFNAGFWYMEPEQVKGLFDPIVNQIEDLIAEQWMRIKDKNLSSKAIVLVGGLGSSEYLFRCLKSTFDGIEVMQPKNAWSAVVRGAVQRGQEGNQVDNRIARCSYGVEMIVEATLADRQKGVNIGWCPLDEYYYRSGVMQWYITKGEALSADNPVSFSFCRAISKSHLARGIVFHERLDFSQTEKAPKYADKSISKLCEVEADLSRIPPVLFEERKNSKGETYYRVQFELVLIPASATLVFELHFNGVSYGMVRSRY
ncbi:unnamed protein product [Penicillium olsonii]|nr:unnamed protein product [Penicillium olsonii]